MCVLVLCASHFDRFELKFEREKLPLESFLENRLSCKPKASSKSISISELPLQKSDRKKKFAVDKTQIFAKHETRELYFGMFAIFSEPMLYIDTKFFRTAKMLKSVLVDHISLFMRVKYNVIITPINH